MAGLLFPRTDAGVLAQVVVVAFGVVAAMVATWRHRDYRLVVTGLGLVALGALGLRALH